MLHYFIDSNIALRRFPSFIKIWVALTSVGQSSVYIHHHPVWDSKTSFSRCPSAYGRKDRINDRTPLIFICSFLCNSLLKNFFFLLKLDFFTAYFFHGGGAQTDCLTPPVNIRRRVPCLPLRPSLLPGGCSRLRCSVVVVSSQDSRGEGGGVLFTFLRYLFYYYYYYYFL